VSSGRSVLDLGLQAADADVWSADKLVCLLLLLLLLLL
jgi:hypothetical protein